MSLESKSQELKEFISRFDTQWFLGDLNGLMKSIANNTANDQLGKLSSPLKQLYYLGGLLITSDGSDSSDIQYSHEDWNKIVDLMNSIEKEYDQLFFPKPDEEIDEEWKKIREVAVPSFLTYFNQGPLNYQEQILNWIEDLYTDLDQVIEDKTGLVTKDFVTFYQNLDSLIHRKFNGFSHPRGEFDSEWLNYSNLKVETPSEVPDFFQQMGEENRPLFTFMRDKGIINRFYPKDLVSDELSLDQINAILTFLSCERSQTDFIYFTAANPLFEKPIVHIGNDMYQVLEIKQVIHAVEILFENICGSSQKSGEKLKKKKGKLLESKIIEVFGKFLKKDYRVFQSYYVDGCEQDILILWKNYAFIIEAKGYKLREPLRDPDKAFTRIKDDFKKSIGYGYTQTKRVEQKFVDQVPLRIEDEKGNLIEEIDTTKYEDNDYSIIVNLNSFGQIQNDLSTLLEVDEDDAFPLAIKFDDLEVLLLTLIAKKKRPEFFVDYLLLREALHGKLICTDELEIAGWFLSGALNIDKVEKADQIEPGDTTKIFDDLYEKGMGFKNERFWKEKRNGKYLIW